MKVFSEFKGIFNSKKNSLKLNTVANFAGSISVALISLLFVPVYLHYLGVEAYGIIGVFAGLQAILSLLDLGLSPALSRDLARFSAFSDKTREMRDLTRTLETVNWTISAFILVFLLAISPLLAHYWIQPGELSPNTVLQCLMIMSVSTAAQFANGLFVGGLMGLQRQAGLNLINSVFAAVKAVGAVVIIAYFSRTIQAFLIWQAAVTLVQTVITYFFLHISLPKSEFPARFNSPLLKQVWRFAAGTTAIGIVATVLTQADKVVLSRLLTLEYFGYYTIATTVSATGLSVIMGAINNAVYPEFARLVALEDETALRRLYHYSCQLMSVLLMPAAAVLAVFAPEILLLWTRNATIAANTSALLTLTAIAFGARGLLWLPFHLQLAYGWTKLSFYANLTAIFVLIPLMILGVVYYGAIGGAAAGVVLNVGHILLTMYFMHRRILKGELMKWYLQDVALPLIVVLIVCALSRLLASAFTPSSLQIFFVLGLTFTAAVGAASMAAREIRRKIFSYVKIYLLNRRKDFPSSNEL
ncbi:MAG TPA: oligosaccharide flippase family protein [Pyrinomonadaceae bacterium]|jgi:O-antigen/teichoic acid export membrane protein